MIIAFLLSLVAQLFGEVGTAIGKKQVTVRRETIYTMGFLDLFWGTIFFLAFAFFIRGEFIFSLAAWPTFSLRVILEIVQAHVTILAIVYAARSTFSFVRILTIPLLLLTDIILGYAITFNQVIGISLLVLALVLLLLNQGLKTKGVWYVLFTAVNAVVTLSLFKYNISHFNSVEAEQSLVMIFLLVYFGLMSFFVVKENPFRFFKKPLFLGQSLASGLGTVLGSFVYALAPASVITTFTRAGAVLSAVLSGRLYFQEKKFGLKIFAFFLVLLGLIFLVV